MAVIDNEVITAIAPTAVGTSTINTAAIDMAGYDECTFVVRLGTPAANNNIRVQQDVASGGSYADLTGTLVSHATTNQLTVTVIRPGKQFLRCQITRGTSTTIDTCVVIQRRFGGLFPVTQPALSVNEVYVSPAEGTA